MQLWMQSLGWRVAYKGVWFGRIGVVVVSGVFTES